jgi:hypothetical protein
MHNRPMKDIISDTSDPATLRPDIPPTTQNRNYFNSINLLDFKPKINFLLYILPSDAWGIFRLFFPTEIIYQLINHTNNKTSQLLIGPLAYRSRLKE